MDFNNSSSMSSSSISLNPDIIAPQVHAPDLRTEEKPNFIPVISSFTPPQSAIKPVAIPVINPPIIGHRVAPPQPANKNEPLQLHSKPPALPPANIPIANHGISPRMPNNRAPSINNDSDSDSSEFIPNNEFQDLIKSPKSAVPPPIIYKELLKNTNLKLETTIETNVMKPAPELIKPPEVKVYTVTQNSNPRVINQKNEMKDVPIKEVRIENKNSKILKPDSNYGKHRQEFISHFYDFNIQKTFCDQFCCAKVNDFFILKKISESRAHYTGKSSLEKFIIEKIPDLKNSYISAYTIIDLFILSSLLEIDSLIDLVKNFKDILIAISLINKKVVKVLSKDKRRQNLAQFFFDHTMEFWINSLRKNIQGYSGLNFEELRNSLNSN